jgi:hypothetical protein
LLGDTDKAKRQILLAWGLSKIGRDPAATVRYESLFGQGLVPSPALKRLSLHSTRRSRLQRRTPK